MKQKLYIHVGFPKTGTSTLQKFFYTHRTALGKSGICYPTPVMGSMLKGWHYGHCSMCEVDSIFRHDIISWMEYQKIYLEEMLNAKCKINILSAESLPYDSPENLSVFCKEFHVKIICFFRNIFDFLVSGNKQIIREGLRQDIFTYHTYRNFHILARIEEYIAFFGRDNCLFLNYDKVKKEKNIVDIFFSLLHGDFDFSKYHVENDNTTPADAANMFLYQLSFLPFSFAEWKILKNEILGMDLSAWREYRCTLLPRAVFSLDDDARQAIRRQGELLQDPKWYDKTMESGRELAAIPNHALPPEIQHDIFTRLSENTRATLVRYWPRAGRARSIDPLLPSMEHTSPENFELLIGLHRGYTIGIGDTFLLQQKLKKEREDREREERKRDASCAVISGGTSAVLSQMRACLASLFLASARQAYAIRQSGLFDIPWYLECNADVAQAGIDPVLHYVRYGAREGRDPTPWFSTLAYLSVNPDVFKEGINPFYHYICHGRTEGRQLA